MGVQLWKIKVEAIQGGIKSELEVQVDGWVERFYVFLLWRFSPSPFHGHT